MHNITLICTRHEEHGLCNIDEFYKIIETINPEVIFEELTQSQYNDNYQINSKMEKSDFSIYYNIYEDSKCKKLETEAIKKYLETYQVMHIPVDYFDNLPDTFLRKYQQMHAYVERRSYTYRNLLDLHRMYAGQFGFKYLNTIECVNIDKAVKKEIDEALESFNVENYIKINNTWKELMDKRENEMLRNIYNYCKNNCFNNGLFYIGSGHRESIINKIQKYVEKGELKIIWNYNNCENIL